MTVLPVAPESPQDVLRRLSLVADVQAPRLLSLDQYVSGTVPLSWLAPEIAKSSEGRLKSLTVGWPRLVVTSIEERLGVQGFRSADPGVDAVLWDLWQTNNLDEMSQLAHFDAMVYGRSFAMVWANPDGSPRITVESPKQVAVFRYPGSHIRQFGLKRWVQDNHGHAVLFTETTVYKFVTLGKVVVDATVSPNQAADFPAYGSGWDLVSTLPNPLGVVPIVPLVNRPRVLTPDGESELSDLLPIFDGLNKLFTDLMVASEFGALPRRFATGIDIPEVRDPITGQPTGEVSTDEMFSPLPGRVWLAESAEAKLGEFGGADLAGFSNAIATLTEALGALSGLPPHYLGLHGDQPSSADSIRSSEASLTAKCKRKQRTFGGSWEEVVRLAHAVLTGSFNPSLNRLETVWADCETRSVAQQVDAAAKAVGAGIMSPDFALSFYLGLTNEQIALNATLRRAASLDQAVAKSITQ